ncbi:MAG: hypothetical protein QNJ71_08625 [Acidimicrobiia bacterium]|nr:hypothetical protein [Acidimicrobiia bacterium]
MSERIHITGGASSEIAAAIAAVVAAITAEEKAALATRRRPIHRSQWVEAGHPNEHLAPVTPEEYAKRPGQAPDDVPPVI